MNSEGSLYIPKVIYTGVSNLVNVHPEILENWSNLKNLNPGWHHYPFDDGMQEDFIRTFYDKDILKYYLSIDPIYGAARSDFFRYLLIFEKGGGWLDSKSTCKFGLDSVLKLEDKYLLSHWKNRETGMVTKGIWRDVTLPCPEFQNWFIFAQPKHIFLEKTIENVLRKLQTYHPLISGVGRQAVVTTTGPIIYTETIFPYLESAENRIFSSFENGFRYSIFKGWTGHNEPQNSFYINRTNSLVSNSLLKRLEAFVLLIFVKIWNLF
jgi:mannosyltransferase OCH1-like enzyme